MDKKSLDLARTGIISMNLYPAYLVFVHRNLIADCHLKDPVESLLADIKAGKEATTLRAPTSPRLSKISLSRKSSVPEPIITHQIILPAEDDPFVNPLSATSSKLSGSLTARNLQLTERPVEHAIERRQNSETRSSGCKYLKYPVQTSSLLDPGEAYVPMATKSDSQSSDSASGSNVISTPEKLKRVSKSSSNITGNGTLLSAPDTGPMPPPGRPDLQRHSESDIVSDATNTSVTQPPTFLEDASTSSGSLRRPLSCAGDDSNHKRASGYESYWHKLHQSLSDPEPLIEQNANTDRVLCVSSPGDDYNQPLSPPFVQEKAAKLLGLGLDGYVNSIFLSEIIRH